MDETALDSTAYSFNTWVGPGDALIVSGEKVVARRRMIARLPLPFSSAEAVPGDGEPCDHAGCLSHHSHPCEGCGRIAGMPIATAVPEIRFTTIEWRDDIRKIMLGDLAE